MGTVNGGGGVPGEVLPDRGRVVHSDLGKLEIAYIRKERLQLLGIIVIASDRDIAFMEREPAHGIIADSDLLAEDLPGGLTPDILIPGRIGFLSGGTVKKPVFIPTDIASVRALLQ